ncbi:uncharacterized protein LOC127796410 [Diospyros lotus]|uniref:uncharacterized protein LOC127796410 n=1 Tax=Diospyros lotus TaxID=55363 RepID=UPI002259C1B1|nr:uncharacterized protein LOC127796410 [Diospyros lotus]
MERLSDKKRVRDDSDESQLDSPEVKRLREDLLGNLDDSDLGSTSPDLDSFMKSFEEEISASSPPATVVDLTSESGESQPDLGFLLEASDDELGLPPTATASSSEKGNDVVELVRVSPESSEEFGELWRFDDDQISGYDSFAFDYADNYSGNNNGEYVALDGLFEYSDGSFVSGDYPVPLWRPETMPSQ